MTEAALHALSGVGTLVCIVLAFFAGVAAAQAWRLDRRDSQAAKEQSKTEGN